jgi:hypothetical protein
MSKLPVIILMFAALSSLPAHAMVESMHSQARRAALIARALPSLVLHKVKVGLGLREATRPLSESNLGSGRDLSQPYQTTALSSPDTGLSPRELQLAEAVQRAAQSDPVLLDAIREARENKELDLIHNGGGAEQARMLNARYGDKFPMPAQPKHISQAEGRDGYKFTIVDFTSEVFDGSSSRNEFIVEPDGRLMTFSEIDPTLGNDVKRTAGHLEGSFSLSSGDTLTVIWDDIDRNGRPHRVTQARGMSLDNLPPDLRALLESIHKSEADEAATSE